MMQMALSNAVHPEYGVVTIPFPIPEEEYGHCLELLEALEIGNAVNRDCKVQEVQDGPPILKRLEGSRVNLDELDYLAKRLDSFTDQELAQFQSAAVSYDYSDIVDLINLTFCCQQATVITDFSDLSAIGRNHYMNLHGGSASVDELNALDGKGTARQLIESGSGTITPYGVVYDNGMQLRPVYDGQNFPLYQHQDAVLVLGLTHESDLDMNSATTWLFLPASAERLERALKRGGFEPGSSIHCTCVGGNIQEELEARLDFERESLKNLNTFASAIASIDEAQHAKFKTVIQMANPQSAAER